MKSNSDSTFSSVLSNLKSACNNIWFVGHLRARGIKQENNLCTWAEKHQAGMQSLQLNLFVEVVDLHGAEDLTHGHVQLI